MSTFQDKQTHLEQKTVVYLFTDIERDPSFTQSGIRELHIALGRISQDLKRCLVKGWIKGYRVGVYRTHYFLMAVEFKGISSMIQNNWARILCCFKEVKSQCEQAFERYQKQDWVPIALLSSRVFVNYDAILISDMLALQCVALPLIFKGSA